MMGSEQMFHINEFKKMCGVSVRTLRHYDTIGLLKPVGKTEGGHRLYTMVELQKLQQIRFLQTIGFSLHEIKEMLDTDEWDWSTSLLKQLTYITSEQERLQRIEESLCELINGIAVDGEAFQIKTIIDLYHNHQAKEQLLTNWHTKNHSILEKVPKMGSSDPDSLEWIALVGQLNKHQHLGYTHPRIQQIIHRMEVKKEEDYAGEEAFLHQLWEIRRSEEQAAKHQLYPIAQEVLLFMEQAYDYYMEQASR